MPETPTPAPDAAVQIERARWNAEQGASVAAMDVRAVFRALDAREAQVAALRAELAAADEAEAERKVECPDPQCAASFVSRVPFQAERRLILHYGQVHDALPPVDVAPASPQGEDVIAAVDRALFGTEDGGFLPDEDASVPVGEFRRLLHEMPVPAVPQPADETERQEQ